MTSPDEYLAALSDGHREALSQINAAGLTRLAEQLERGEAIAFLGAGASSPLYPLWNGVVTEILDAASSRLGASDLNKCRATLAAASPEGVVEVVRRRLGSNAYWDILREVFRVRRDEASGLTWTPVHELVVRCDFRGVVTTNYDPGIVDARMRVRPRASSTGFASWSEELALDGWRNGDVFRDGDELPVLFAHGHHNQPDRVVLAATEYRRAYEGKLARVLGAIMDRNCLVWIGFSFVDRQIAAILREIAAGSGTREEPGMAPRHVAMMPWDPRSESDPELLREICEIEYGSDAVLYPAADGNHSALCVLLERFTAERFPAVGQERPAVLVAEARPPTSEPVTAPSPIERVDTDYAVRWVHGGDPVEHFAGRAEELSRMDRWAADPAVRLIGVTAWGGAGKTALVTQWLTRYRDAGPRPEARGVFGWSFYENSSEEAWARELLDWVRDRFGIEGEGGGLLERVLDVAQRIGLVLVLDGLELLQEGPDGGRYGRLLSGLLRDVLTALCRFEHDGLAVLTSRFVFADLERYEGGTARMLDVPGLTGAEGAAYLASAGARWLDEPRRFQLAEAVDGHALAVGALAGALAIHRPTEDLDALIEELGEAGRTNERVHHVLAFYEQRLGNRDRALVAIVSLFQRPVRTAVVLRLGASAVLRSPLAGWTAADMREAVQRRLGGLLSWHADETVSAHPLVRDSFHEMALTPDSAQLASELTLDSLPVGRVRLHEHALSVADIIELLLDADEWDAADQLYRARTGDGIVFLELPAAALGLRCARAFVGVPKRSSSCRRHLGDGRWEHLTNDAGLFALNTGDVAAARAYLRTVVDRKPGSTNQVNRATWFQNLAECEIWIGEPDRAREHAEWALVIAQQTEDNVEILDSRIYLAWSSYLAGKTAFAERQFLDVASRVSQREGGGVYLSAVAGCWWSHLLLRTGRARAARALVGDLHAATAATGRNQIVARCEQMLGLCDLVDGKPAAADTHLQKAAAAYRQGEMQLELAAVLVDIAQQRRRAGRLDDAEHTCSEAIEIAALRELFPTHSAALAVRAMIRLDRRASDPARWDPEDARDDARSALRFAETTRQLPWQALDAMAVHALIDEAEGIDGGWAARARESRDLLVPVDLDPDPLATADATLRRGVG